MKLTDIIVLAAFVMICTGLAHAEKIYKWTDENGVVHFSQKKPVSQTNITAKTMSDTKSHEDSTKTTTVEAAQGDSATQQGCIVGKDSFNDHGKVVCCNERCVKERFEQGLEITCYARECHQEIAKLRFQQDEKKRKQIENQFMRNKRLAREFQEKRDRKTVEECKRRRNVYCDEGAEGIRKIEAERDEKYQREKEMRQRYRDMYPELR